MAYEEPGVKVIQQLALEQANVADAQQAAVLVGELFEVFEDREAGDYDPLPGSGDQAFTWPGKMATSIVDLAGVRKSTAETDSQLRESAPYQLIFRLRDPVTGALTLVDDLEDVFALNQTGFSLVEASGAASARIAGVSGTMAMDGKLRLRVGGLVNARVTAGDRVRVTNVGGAPAFDVRGSVSSLSDESLVIDVDGDSGSLVATTSAGATSLSVTMDALSTLPTGGNLRLRLDSGDKTEIVTFSSPPTFSGLTATFTLVGATRLDHDAGVDVKVLIADQAAVSVNDGSVSAASGQVQSASAPFTAGNVGDRLAVWQESLFDNAGAVAGAGLKVETAGLALTGADVGKLVTVWTDVGAHTQADGDLDTVSGQLSSALATFAAADVGKFIAIGGEYRRVTAVLAVSGPGIVSYNGPPLSGISQSFTVYRDQQVRSITAVDAAVGGNDFWVDTSITAVAGGLPVVVHRQELRDITSLASSSAVTYSGGGLVPELGLGLHVPVRLFAERVTFQVSPLFQVLASYRALNVAGVNETLVVRTGAQISSLGVVNKHNPLLWAARSALTAMGTSDVPLLLQPVKTFADGNDTGFPEDRDEVGGYLQALEMLTSVDSAFYLVPLTRNATIRDAFDGHVQSESQPEIKRERVCFLTYNLPLGVVESNTGIIAPGADGGNKVLRDPGRGFISVHGLIPGNKAVVTFPSAYAGEYTVAAGSDDDELVLEGDNWRQDSAGAFLTGAVEFTRADVSFGGQSGSTASFSAPVGVVVTVTGLTGMGVADVGRQLVVSSAVEGVNVGSFTILSFISATSVTISHVAGLLESGTIVWSLTADGTARSAVPEAWKDVEAGDYLVFGAQTRLVTGVDATYQILSYSGAPFSANSGQEAGVVRTSPGVVFYARPLNKDAQAEALAASSQGRGSRRVLHLWPDACEQVTGTDSSGGEVLEFLPSFYAAAAEAGRCSVLAPQLSSTGEALAGFTGLRHSAGYFSRQQLNVIAGGGWTVLEQRNPGSPVKIRHLLTTDMSSVKTQELSFTKNVDNMAKVKRASVEPLLNSGGGRVNISADLLAALAFPLQGIYEGFVSRGQLVKTEGKPAYRIISIRQDPLSPDSILEDAELNVPLPANRVVVTFAI